MNTKRFATRAIVLMAAGCLACGGAFGDKHHGKLDLGQAIRSMPALGQMAGNHNGVRLPQLSGKHSGLNFDPSVLRNIGSALRNANGYQTGHGAYGGNFGGLFNQSRHNGWGGYSHGSEYYGGDYSTARAIRDVGMANAFVNLAGIAVSATREPVYYAQPMYYAPPSGHYVRERIILQPPHYETCQVWIPETYDPRSGQRAGGYYETRTQSVPETCQYRDVWIPDR